MQWKKTCLWLMAGGLVLLTTPKQTTAQTADQVVDGQFSLGIAHYIAVEDTAPAGTIISQFKNKYSISSESYDKGMIGVVVGAPPAVAFVPEDSISTVPMITEGVVPVLVNGSNGSIQPGDKITSSATPGQGMKANQTGFILGIAQSSFDPANPEQTDLVMTMLDVKFAFIEDSPDSEKIGKRLLDVLSLSSIAAIQEPLEVFKYVVAGISVLSGIAITGFTFLQSARRGLEALGRNPLASKPITVGILINVTVSFLIIASSVAVAYLVITL